ncbi:MAG TPA: hypothetical protein VLG40_03105 [Candidatus Saccharimonas sp.]|nr:hypothetical protein [Candidatus Saccharimonas sp.]
MQCLVIYGPPAVGKQTVAGLLARTSNAPIIDNAGIIDLIQPLIGHNNPEFAAVVYSLQLQIINDAMRFGAHDLIVTFTFSASARADVAFLQTLLEAGQRHSVKVQLVHLTAKKRALLERVALPGRKAAHKLDDPKILEAMLQQYDMESPYPYQTSTTINTTHLLPQEVADQIRRATDFK